jgi:DNA-binding NtrC family response regulator
MTIKLEEVTQNRMVEGPSQRLAFAVSGLAAGEPAQPMPLRVFRAQAEARAISWALDFAGWNRRRAAKLLRISYRGLLYKIRQYNITAASRDGSRAEPTSQPAVEK